MFSNSASRRWGSWGMETSAERARGEPKPWECVYSALRRRPELSKQDPNIDRVYGWDRRLEMIADSDYVVCAAPLTAETKAMFSDSEFGAMKPGGVIINVGRGPVIDEPAMIRALGSGRIKGAGLDVTSVEPLPSDSPLYKMDNVLLSPHCADHTSDWLEDAMRFFVEQFERFRTGRPLENLVDMSRGY